MRFACLGYINAKNWDAIPKDEQDAKIEECFNYDDELLRRGHWLAGGQALQDAQTAKSLRWKDGKVVVTDGPFAETKEQLGGIGILEARDLDHAVELMSKHPGVRMGPFEIRPINEKPLKPQTAGEEQSGNPAARIAADTQKFACMGYIHESWEGVSQDELNTVLEQCAAFDAARRKAGHWISGLALQGSNTAKTLRSKGDKVLVTDGPFPETKEQLGGVVVNQFKDIRQAVDLLSTHPALRIGVVIEIRPIEEETNARWEARKARLTDG